MARLANRILLGVVLSFALTEPAHAQTVTPRQCGYDRWPVKTLTDKDNGRVNFTPVVSTIAVLTSVPIHEIPYPMDRRIQPDELKVYRIRARLVTIRREQDLDLHLIIADPVNPNVSMIGEIPASECAAGTRYQDAYRDARAFVLSLPASSIVELTSVGFFDFLHTARGAARNGMELHPVLSIHRVE